MRTREHLKPPKEGLILPTLEHICSLQDSNLHFDIMNIKFYLLSQELGSSFDLFFLQLFSKFSRTIKPSGPLFLVKIVNVFNRDLRSRCTWGDL